MYLRLSLYLGAFRNKLLVSFHSTYLKQFWVRWCKKYETPVLRISLVESVKETGISYLIISKNFLAIFIYI